MTGSARGRGGKARASGQAGPAPGAGELERASVRPPTREEATASITATVIERGGERLLLLPDGDRHERRIQRLWPGGGDRLFWVTLTIACGDPGTGRRRKAGSGPAAARLAKRFGHLAKARHDLHAYRQYYRPMQIGSPDIVGAVPGLGKCAGYFDHTVPLDNPTVDEVREAIGELRRWLDVNQGDPEYRSFQFNLAFSGHGDLEADGGGSLVLADRTLPAGELASMLLDVMPEAEDHPAPCRLDLFLDCCHAAAVASTLTARLIELQSGNDATVRSRLDAGQIYCACLADEESYELADAPHSLFTFAFLNECSRCRPEGAASFNLALRDLGWFTGGGQHPLLLDLTQAPGLFKFPPMYVLTRGPTALPADALPAYALPGPAERAADPVGAYVRLAAALREHARPIEERIERDPSLAVPFRREEILGNAFWPFL